MKLVAFVGLKNSGKTTAAIALQEDGFLALSFADAIKDALASIFCWPRYMLEGDTPESRAWREQIDPWWAEKLGILNFSPRLAMQNIGTDAMREHFHQDIWILNVERRIATLPKNTKIVLVDGRFPNEISMATRLGGIVTRIKKGDDPFWYNTAITANTGSGVDRVKAIQKMEFNGIHKSEWAWIGTSLHQTIENDGSIADLHAKLRKVCC